MTMAFDNQTLFNQAVDAMRGGDVKRGKALLDQVVATNPRDINAWLNLALAEQTLGDPVAELRAIDNVLKLEPRTLVALLLKGNYFERLGQTRNAAQTYTNALQVAPPFDEVPNDLKPMIRRAVEVTRGVAQEREAFIRAHVASAYNQHSGPELRRFDEALDVVVGRKAIYRQNPLLLFWPGLPALQFYPREQFPWLDAIEAATDDIKGELVEVLKQDRDMVPYINYDDSLPLDQWRELNRSPDWSAYHLIKDGKRVHEHCDLCPKTVQAVGLAPSPSIHNQSPVAMFSILKPGITIPPHTGATNARLVCHLPLIIPDDCSFRVGNETRQWVPGKAWVFDDTIEHEAWNNSGKTRVILIFDIWNPYLNEAERELIPILIKGMFDFMGEDAAARAAFN
ncbi:MAG TPA: aspartyl/asparaginyl beta-hydroxylase domain-containing protein [Caulobacteraceae bacterium]|jgi:aspartyl/asparaginyl beta-hydroxylase (cupin superfamily)|nr:aspartyl/asparaginyl beta-hydroxylase domain-containing protein [Caulobacteraceae bacterium]